MNTSTSRTSDVELMELNEILLQEREVERDLNQARKDDPKWIQKRTIGADQWQKKYPERIVPNPRTGK